MNSRGATQVVTGELKSQVDKVWNAFWSGGIANPMEIIEQITYLLFIKRLDELHTLAENKANMQDKEWQYVTSDHVQRAARILQAIAIEAANRGMDVVTPDAQTPSLPGGSG